MAEVAAGTPSVSSTDADPSHFPRYDAGEAIFGGAAIAIRSDGLAHLAIPTDNRVIGFAARNADAGEPVTPARGQRFWYGAAPLTPGTDLFLSATVPGGLATTAPGSGNITVALAHAIDTQRIQSLI